jgi:hypothetical protein
VTVGSGLEVLGPLEAELLDNDTRTEIPIVLDDLDELGIGLLASAVGVDVDGEGLGNTDGVGELNENAASKASGDEGFGYKRL